MKASQVAQRKICLPVPETHWQVDSLIFKGFVNVFAFDSLRNTCLSDALLSDSWWVRRMERGPPRPQNEGFSREMGLQS